MAVKKTKPCGVEIAEDVLCEYPRKYTKQKCVWHWLLGQPIDVQIQYAASRLAEHAASGLPKRARVAKEKWPEGERWCADCQDFVPLFYTQGSRCYACESRAKHASMVQNTYELPAVDYDRLLAWQGGRCYICRKVPRVRRLAVDHDHRTGKVRGLLCANNEWGCNVLLAQMLNDIESAQRLVAYLEKYPYERMKSGEEAVYIPPVTSAIMDSLERSVQMRKDGTYEQHIQDLRNSDDWNPFAESKGSDIQLDTPKTAMTENAPASTVGDGGEWAGWNF